MHKFIKNKLKEFIKKPFGMFTLIAVASGLLLIIIVKVFISSNSTTKTAAQMATQSTPDIQGNVRYTTQETLSTLTGETDNIEKSLSAVQQEFKKIKESQGDVVSKTQQKVAQELEKLKQENQEFKDKLSQSMQAKDVSKYDDLKIGGAKTVKTQTVWINDMSQSDKAKSDVSLDNTPNQDNSDQEVKSIPAYTIPANTILTGVVSEQPLIGVIPTDGTVVNPQTVMFAVGAKNLAANNWHLPVGLKGIQGNAVCQGVFNFQHSAVSCNITSLTFIFKDGTIATQNASKERPFGKLTTLYGNAYIPGTYHGNALYGAIGTGAFSGLQGFGNAFAASQVETQTSLGSVVTSFKNANDYALGQGVGTTGEALNNWWLSLLKSTTDYVFVPNWDAKTHQILQLNAKIEREVDIDYNPKGRKVQYEQKDTFANNSLD